MPRGRKKKAKLNLNIKQDTAKSLAAVILVLLSGLFFISFIVPNYTLNAKIQSLLRGTFGEASWLIPFLTLFTALFLIESIKIRIKQFRIYAGFVLSLFCFSALFHVFYRGSNALELAEKGFGGGMVGYKISSLLSGTISVYGAILVILFGLMASFIVMFNVSFEQILGALSSLKQKVGSLPKPIALDKKKSVGDDIVISTNFEPSSEDFYSQKDAEVGVDSKKDKSSKKKGKSEESFEIVATMSEPAGDAQLIPIPDLSSVNSIAASKPGLPYTDRVWEYPPLDLLIDASNAKPDTGDVNERAKVIKDTLKSFGIGSDVVEIQSGPSVTQYALEADSGTKISKIYNLQYDIALALASPTGSVRIEAPIPGKSLIGIEVPNNTRTMVSFKSLLTSESMKSVKSKLGVVLGKDVAGQTRVYDVAKMPHLLVAGATGSGKSVFLHSLIFSILYRSSPQEVNFIMMDPKRTELIHYNEIPHLISPVITDVDKAPAAFKWAVNEMTRRYKLFEAAKARNIESYNEKSGFQALPYIIIVVDELAEIMIVDPASVEKNIIRIAQLARATGIHLVLAVQRPSTNIITGLIKANIPSRISFNVASQVDSRVIIDQPGAEKLLGKGDMLFIPPDVPKPIRLQGAFVTDKEITNLVDYLKSQGIKPEYKPEILEANERTDKSIAAGGGEVDSLFDEAVEVVTSTGQASASFLQRRLAIGYARAARIIDEMEEKGIIGPKSGSKPREILIKHTQSDELGDLDFTPNEDVDNQ